MYIFIHIYMYRYMYTYNWIRVLHQLLKSWVDFYSSLFFMKYSTFEPVRCSKLVWIFYIFINFEIQTLFWICLILISNARKKYKCSTKLMVHSADKCLFLKCECTYGTPYFPYPVYYWFILIDQFQADQCQTTNSTNV